MLFTLFFFFFHDTATTEIYTLSLHDALPIYLSAARLRNLGRDQPDVGTQHASGRAPRTPTNRGYSPKPKSQMSAERGEQTDRKSTRLNSSHVSISYAVFCLKKKNTRYTT